MMFEWKCFQLPDFITTTQVWFTAVLTLWKICIFAFDSATTSNLNHSGRSVLGCEKNSNKRDVYLLLGGGGVWERGLGPERSEPQHHLRGWEPVLGGHPRHFPDQPPDFHGRVRVRCGLNWFLTKTQVFRWRGQVFLKKKLIAIYVDDFKRLLAVLNTFSDDSPDGQPQLWV